MRRRRRANTKPQSETLRPRIGPKSIGRFGYHYTKLELASRVTSFNPVSPALRSCSQIMLGQGRTVVCLTLAKWETVSGQFGGYLTHRSLPRLQTKAVLAVALAAAANH